MTDQFGVIFKKTHRVRALNFEQSGGIKGMWDLATDALAVDYTGPSPIASIRSFLVSGRGTGSWNGTGLASTDAGSSNGKYALGYAEALEVIGAGGGPFGNLVVDDSSVLVKFTYAGDANLDGKVDVADLGRLATHWQGAGDWSGGDFDYNGVVNVADLGLLATNWQAGVGNPLGPGSLIDSIESFGLPASIVPEPSAFTLLILPVFPCRRKRHKIG
jgi:hypothetical protein